MRFIKHALIGIAFYEAMKYLWTTCNSPGLAPDPLRTGMPHVGDDLSAGNNPQAALTGQDSKKDKDDPWKNSLADDDLRAPDA